MIYMKDSDSETTSPVMADNDTELQSSSSSESDKQKENVYEKFGKIIIDFMRDLLITFPELKEDLDANLLEVCNGNPSDNTIKTIRDHCIARMPERFFDILYQNDDIFENESVDLCFLPGIDFHNLWKTNITETTRATIWKYLQLLLFDTISDMTDGSSFGDTAKLFEAIDEDVFRNKLEETITQMQGMFEEKEDMNDENESKDDETSQKEDNHNIPNPEDIHEHVSSMMDGKLGALAKEIAEETAQEMDLDMNESSDVNDLFKKLFKNPTKLMGLVQNVGSKIDKKLKDGNIKESELIQEATDLIKKMKDTPGMGNLQDMFAKMGMPIPQGGKINPAAMQAHLARSMKLAKQRERMQAKYTDKNNMQNNVQVSESEFLEQQRKADQAAAALLKSEGYTDGIESLKYSTGDSALKSTKESKPKKKKKRK